MIRTFADKITEELFDTGRCRKVSPEIWNRALQRMTLLDNVSEVSELMQPPSNRLHALEGDRKGQYSISVNTQWRICFRFEDGDAFEVQFCDYH